MTRCPFHFDNQLQILKNLFCLKGDSEHLQNKSYDNQNKHIVYANFVYMRIPI